MEQPNLATSARSSFTRIQLNKPTFVRVLIFRGIYPPRKWLNVGSEVVQPFEVNVPH